MALTLINANAPRYTALSTDIVLSKIAGLTYVGAIVHILDDGSEYIVSDGAGTLVAYAEKVSGTMTATVSGTIAVSAIAAGETHLGEVGGKENTITWPPAISTGGAYVAGDYVGTDASPITFTGATRVSGGTGIIHSAVLVDKDLQSKTMELWLFDTAPTPPADNAAWTISDADSATLIGVIVFDTYYASALNSVANPTNLGIAFKAVGGSSIYGCLVTRGTPTYSSGNGSLTIRLSILQD